MWSLKIINALLILHLAPSSETNVNQCKNGEQLPLQANVTSNGVLCDNSPCTVYIGTSADISFVFLNPEYSESMNLSLAVTAYGAHINWPTKLKDGCDAIINTNCPVVKGESIKYLYKMEVSPFFPTADVNLEVSLMNNNIKHSKLTCFAFDLQVRRK